jgi:hypothetical protein
MADRGADELYGIVVSPIISPSGGTYQPPQLITITVEEGDVYYTLDGTLPTSASTLYTAPFYIDGTVIMAIALVSGTYSAIMSGSFDAYAPNFILSGGYWVRDISKFETSASNYEDKPSLQDNLIVDIEISATANKNEILSSVSTVSGNVNTILTSAHGSGQWDSVSVIGEVVLSASQPNYPAALQSTLLSVSADVLALGTPMQTGALVNANVISLAVTGDAIISGSLVIKQDFIVEGEIDSTTISLIEDINVGRDFNVGRDINTTNINAQTIDTLGIVISGNSIATEISATVNKNEILSSITSVSGDILALGTPMQSGTPVTLDPNTRAVLSAGQPDYNIPVEVNAILTSAHGSGQWDAITIVSQVVLSADQPYYAPAKAGDPVTLTSGAIADIQNGLIKHADTIDGKTVDYVLEAVMAMVNGNFTLSGDTMTLYKRDGATPFSVMSKTITTRTRTS